MDKRRLAYTLLCVGLTFVALLHTALAFAFDTGLEEIDILVAGLGVFGIFFVPFGLPAPASETDVDPEESGASADGTETGSARYRIARPIGFHYTDSCRREITR